MKIFFPFALALIILPLTAWAQMDTFQQIPFWNRGEGSTSFLEALYTLAIAAAAILVVIRLIMAGVEYMFSEMITSKAKAKEKIQGALLGLVIILGAVTILSTINPRLTNLDVIGQGTPVMLAGQRNASYEDDLDIGDYVSNEWALYACGQTTECIDYLSGSCASNGGVLEYDRWFWTGLNGLGAYICQDPSN